MMIIDAHTHIGCSPDRYVPDVSVDAFLSTMDELDIDISISCNTYCLVLLDFKGGSEYASRIFKETNGRIRSYFFYHPDYAQECLQVCSAYEGDPAFCGIKIHPPMSYTNADDEKFRPVWEYARQHKLPILAHTWDFSSYNPKQGHAFPAKFVKYVREYPDVNLIMGHSGGRYGGIKVAAELGKRYSNIYYDTAGDIWPNGFIEYMVRNIGSHRIMYGSDYTMMDQRLMMGVILGADIPLKDKENILYNTAGQVILKTNQ
jgi:predicted TIM-barrel fold metal-dependent hydrolase